MMLTMLMVMRTMMMMMMMMRMAVTLMMIMMTYGLTTMLLLMTHHDNMGAYMVALTRGIALDRLAFSRTGHLYMRQYKRGREGSVFSNTAAWDRVEDHP